MDEHPTPPLRRVLLRTGTIDILKETASIFSTRKNLHMFLLLSFMLFFQRLVVEQVTDTLISSIDNEPSIKSYYSQIPEPPKSTSPTTAITTKRRLPHHVGTLDDDLDHPFFGNLPKPQSNSTSFILESFDPQFGFFNSVSGAGITAPETVGSTDIIEKEEDAVTEEIKDSQPIKETPESQSDSHDFTALLSPTVIFLTSYGQIISFILGFQSLVRGVIFVLVLNDFCRRNTSSVVTFANGCSLGLKRSLGFIVVRWLSRLAITLFFGYLFFAEVEDRYTALKIFVRLWLLPISFYTPWVKEFEKEFVIFIVTWLIFEIMHFALTVDVWVVMADPGQINEREATGKGFRLMTFMIKPAIELKLVEGLVCGPYARWLIAKTFGDLFAMALQCFMEIYFMAAWMVYYLSVKSIDANLRGQPFGQGELEAMIPENDG